MDKFLIATNPMGPDESLWVIHLLNPKAIIRCTEGHVVADTYYKHYQFDNGECIEEWTLSDYHFFTQDFISEPEQQVIPLLDKAWRWYRSYRQKEYNNDPIEWFKQKAPYLPISRIEQELGMPASTLHRFVKGERGLAEQWHDSLIDWIINFQQ